MSPDFQQQLQKAGHQIPIILITGDGDLLMTVEAMKFGALEFLTKRFEGQILLDTVKQIQPATPFVANKGRNVSSTRSIRPVDTARM
ncbi:MAG: response regulator [Acidobacteriaceae bacterium]